jgi:hypothetical protein
MSHCINKDTPTQNLESESEANYKKAELDLLKDSLTRTYTERFLFATRLYKIQQTLNKAKITHKPYTLDK